MRRRSSIGFMGIFGRSADLRQLDEALRSVDLHPRLVPEAVKLTVVNLLKDHAVGPEIAEALRRHWDEGEIVEILGVVALFGYLNRWNDSMGTTLEEGAAAVGAAHLSPAGWSAGKHG